jgi:flagellin
MRINTNIASLNAQANNTQTNMNLQNSLEKLSSGLKINKAADDASGMAIADKLRTQASSIGQGIANANSGSALIQIADKAMAEQSNILDIVKTKLLQAATSTTSPEGREAIRKDVGKLLQQLDNISVQTTYNGVNLLDNKGQDFNFQIGEKSTDIVGLTTAYAVNTVGLGSTGVVSKDSEAVVKFGAAGSVALGKPGTAITLQNISTVAGDKKAITINGDGLLNTVGATESAIMVSGDKVESIVARIQSSTVAGDGAIMMETTDPITIAALNAIAGSDANLLRLDDGAYKMVPGTASGTVQIDFSVGGIDLTSVKFSGLTVGTAAANTDVLTFETSGEITVEKISGADIVSLDASVVTDQSGDTAQDATVVINANLTAKNISDGSGLTFGGQVGSGTLLDSMVLESGTLTMKGDVSTTIANARAAIGINTKADTLSAAGDATLIINAKEVTSIILKNSLGTGEVVLMTDDDATREVLENAASSDVNLTSLGGGQYRFEASAANADAVLTFGDDNKINMTNLKFANVSTSSLDSAGGGIMDKIFIETDAEVSVTKVGTKDGGEDVSMAGFNILTGNAVSAANAVGVLTEGALTNTDSLNALKELGEDELTALVANEFITSIDTAMTQLNSVRSDFGSTQNQLASATRNMMVTQVNIKAAESVIRDVDYAAESANFNKQNIISQAGTYAMSQANQVQQNVLRLLQ